MRMTILNVNVNCKNCITDNKHASSFVMFINVQAVMDPDEIAAICSNRFKTYGSFS